MVRGRWSALATGHWPPTTDHETFAQSTDLDFQVSEVISHITSAAYVQLSERARAIVERLVGEIEYFAADQPILDQLNAGATHNFSITMAILRHDVEIEQVGLDRAAAFLGTTPVVALSFAQVASIEVSDGQTLIGQYYYGTLAVWDAQKGSRLRQAHPER